MSLPTQWRVAVAVTNAAAPAYEAALEADAVAISIYERETGTPPRSAPEPATWAPAGTITASARPKSSADEGELAVTHPFIHLLRGNR